MQRNRIKCLLCNDIIESISQHNFVRCSCGLCFVDGGSNSHIGGDLNFILEMPTDDPVENRRITNIHIIQSNKQIDKYKTNPKYSISNKK